MKTVKFYTLGCKVNQYETQVIREQFLNSGFKELENSQPTDIYVINTCTVTHKADSESFNLIRRSKRENPKAKIIVTGCLTELDEDKIKKVNPKVLIVKNKDKEKILFNQDEITRQRDNEITKRGISNFAGHTRAFLKIQDGCNNFCSYCKVPLVRGSSQSRPLDEIIAEAERLAKNNFKEIVLCGICLGSYGQDLNPKISLVDVLGALENIEGLLRIRLSSIEANDISEALIEKMAKSQKICPHLHIPIQSGDDEILKKMNRKITAVDYLRLINKIKTRIPEIAITTDIMVGFPEESEENFKNTINLIKQIIPLKCHIFPYSPRKGTVAYDFKDKVNPFVIKERILRLKNIAQDCSIIYRQQFLNKDREVLIERRSKDKPACASRPPSGSASRPPSGVWEGYTDNYLKVQVESRQDVRNQLVPVRLKKIVKDFVLAERI